jgi:hypothetical protein
MHTLHNCVLEMYIILTYLEEKINSSNISTATPEPVQRCYKMMNIMSQQYNFKHIHLILIIKFYSTNLIFTCYVFCVP